MSDENQPSVVEARETGTIPFFLPGTSYAFTVTGDVYHPHKPREERKEPVGDFVLAAPIGDEMRPYCARIQFDRIGQNMNFVSDEEGEEKPLWGYVRVPLKSRRETIEKTLGNHHLQHGEVVPGPKLMMQRLWGANKLTSSIKEMSFYWALREDSCEDGGSDPFIVGFRRFFPYEGKRGDIGEFNRFLDAEAEMRYEVNSLIGEGVMTEKQEKQILPKFSFTVREQKERGFTQRVVTRVVATPSRLKKDEVEDIWGSWLRANPVESVISNPAVYFFVNRYFGKPVPLSCVERMKEHTPSDSYSRIKRKREALGEKGEYRADTETKELEAIDLSEAEAWRTEREMSEEEIWKRLGALEPPVTQGDFPHGLPRLQQLRAFYISTQLKRICLWMQVGFGKTKTALDIRRFYAARGKAGKTVIVVPSCDLLDEWVDEIQKWSPELRTFVMDDKLFTKHRYGTMHPKMRALIQEGKIKTKTGEHSSNISEAKRQEFYGRDWDVCVMTYAAMTQYCTSEGKAKYNSKGDRVPNMVHDDAKILAFVEDIGMVIYDESTAFKNEKSKRASVAESVFAALGEEIPIVGLSGTPMTKGSELSADIPDAREMYGQLRAVTGIDRQRFLEFFDRYRIEYPDFVSEGFAVKPDKQKALVDYIGKRAVMLRTDKEALPPQCHRKVIEIPTPDAVEELIDEVLDRAAGYEKAKGLLSFSGVSHAVLGLKGGMECYDGLPLHQRLVSEEKQERAGKLIAQWSEQGAEKCSNIIVVTRYHSSVGVAEEIIRPYVKEAGRELIVHHADRRWSMNERMRFRHEPGSSVLLSTDAMLQPGGLNLQAANTMIFLCAPHSIGLYKQIEGRIWRPGQKLESTIFRIQYKSDDGDEKRPCFESLRWLKVKREEKAIDKICSLFGSESSGSEVMNMNARAFMDWYTQMRKKQ